LMFQHTIIEAGYSPKKSAVKFDASCVCIIYKRNQEGRWEELSRGSTHHNDDKDEFSFYMGRKNALASAMKSSGLDTKTRGEFWDSFLKVVGIPVPEGELTFTEAELKDAVRSAIRDTLDVQVTCIVKKEEKK